jgi:hypothetical protein
MSETLAFSAPRKDCDRAQARGRMFRNTQSPLSGSVAVTSCFSEEDPQQQLFDGCSGTALSGLIFDGIFVFSISKCIV